MVKEISAELERIDRMPPTEQLLCYFAIGRKIGDIIETESKYGQHPLAEAVSRVPRLRSDEFAHCLRNFSMWEDVHEFMLTETATPMGDGRHLSIDHWRWLFRHRPRHYNPSPMETDSLDYEWFGRELAWLRRESPSASALEHVDQVWEAETQREEDQRNEGLRKAIEILEGL